MPPRRLVDTNTLAGRRQYAGNRLRVLAPRSVDMKKHAENDTRENAVKEKRRPLRAKRAPISLTAMLEKTRHVTRSMLTCYDRVFDERPVERDEGLPHWAVQLSDAYQSALYSGRLGVRGHTNGILWISFETAFCPSLDFVRDEAPNSFCERLSTLESDARVVLALFDYHRATKQTEFLHIGYSLTNHLNAYEQRILNYLIVRGHVRMTVAEIPGDEAQRTLVAWRRQ